MVWLRLEKGVNWQSDWALVIVKAVQRQETACTAWSTQLCAWQLWTKRHQRQSLKFSSGRERRQKSYDMDQILLCYHHQVCRKITHLATLYSMNWAKVHVHIQQEIVFLVKWGGRKPTASMQGLWFCPPKSSGWINFHVQIFLIIIIYSWGKVGEVVDCKQLLYFFLPWNRCTIKSAASWIIWQAKSGERRKLLWVWGQGGIFALSPDGWEEKGWEKVW